MKKKSGPYFLTSDVIEAACAVFRLNNGKIVRDSDEEVKDKAQTSKAMLEAHFTGDTKLDITDEDKSLAIDSVQYVQQRIMMDALVNKDTTEFIGDVSNLTHDDTISVRDFGRIVWLPKIYKQMFAADQTKNDINFYALSSKHVGKLGEKITVEFTPLSSRWSRDYNCWRQIGVDANNNLISFLSKNQFSGKIQGKIKHQGTSKFYGNGKVTYLNYVKEAK